MFVFDCATPCRLLGSNESVPQRIEAEKTQVDTTPINDEKPELKKAKNAEVSFVLLV